MEGKEEHYEFHRGDRGVFSEIYFPRKAAHQGTIFDALREGHNEDAVKGYLRDNIDTLLEELRDYPYLFDPDQYESDEPRQSSPKPEKAIERINKYHSPFKGWSLYQVDGVFFDNGKPMEEATQVVRVMFRFESDSDLTEEAIQADCKDVLRSMIFWTITHEGRLDNNVPWSKEELSRYLLHHEPWPEEKRKFAEKHFSKVARNTEQWIDDCALFLFGYLVRKFWENVLKEELKEKEIWVTSFFNLTVNVIKKTEIQKTESSILIKPA